MEEVRNRDEAKGHEETLVWRALAKRIALKLSQAQTLGLVFPVRPMPYPCKAIVDLTAHSD